MRLENNVVLEGRNPKTGKLIEYRDAKNLFVATGREAVRNSLAGPGISIGGLVNEVVPAASAFSPKTIAMGTGSTAVTDADVALGTESTRKLVLRRSGPPYEAILQTVFFFNEGNGVTYSEAGLFATTALTATSGELMFARVIFGGLNKTDAIELTITWSVKIKF